MNEAIIDIRTSQYGSRNNYFFYGLLAYTVIFYSQIAFRIPVLKPFRLEFVLGAVLVIIAVVKLARKEIPFDENRLNTYAVMFLLYMMLLIPFAYVKARSFEMFIHFTKFFPIYLFIIAAVDGEKKFRLLMLTYVGMITLLFIEPFILSLQGKGFMFNNHMMRLAGVTNYFGHPNQLGGMTAENLPFLYYLMKHERSKAMKLIYLALMVAALRVIMLTQSRTGFVGVLAFGLCLFLFSKKKGIALIAIILASVAIWSFSPEETRQRFLTMSNIGKVVTTDAADFNDERFTSLGSMASRWELLRRGFVAFLDNPIIGIGPGGFISYNGNHWGYWFPPHNTYIQALSEMGIIGFWIFMLVLIHIFRNLRKTKRILGALKLNDTFLGYMTTALIMYMIIRMVIAFFGQDLYENYWWVAGGMSVVLLRIAKLKKLAVSSQDDTEPTAVGLK